MAGRMKNKNRDMVPEGFTLSMALMDMLPVLFFCAGTIVLSLRFPSALFRIGACLVTLAGAGKVLWKLVIALAKKNVWFLNRQMRYLMPTGFLLMLLSLIADRKRWSAAAVTAHVCSFPAAVFFIAGIIGMCLMGYYAKHNEQMDARSNWIEQGTNALAQMCIFLGILL